MVKVVNRRCNFTQVSIIFRPFLFLFKALFHFKSFFFSSGSKIVSLVWVEEITGKLWIREPFHSSNINSKTFEFIKTLCVKFNDSNWNLKLFNYFWSQRIVFSHWNPCSEYTLTVKYYRIRIDFHQVFLSEIGWTMKINCN